MRTIRTQKDVEKGLQILLRLDPRLQAVARDAGPLPLRLMEPGFAGLASIVVSQMISRASAQAIWQRIVAAGSLTASSYAELSPETIATFGLSRGKAATLAALSRSINDGGVDLQAIGELDASEGVKRLSRSPGIGPWTAEVYLMFCVGHPDIFPGGDVALQAAVAKAFALDARPNAKTLAAMAETWAPWRSVAARLFWAYYAHITQRTGLPVS